MNTITVKTHAEIKKLMAIHFFKTHEIWESPDDRKETHGFELVEIQNGALRSIDQLSDWPCDIAAAWTVVEKMEQNNIYPRIEKRKTVWACGRLVNLSMSYSISPTAPLAICLCALASVGIEVKLEIERTLCGND